ncbi:6-phosphogluconolactonase [Brachybacterium sp. JHP9]|uniref:6-phosphogluconolactonase n=1 Tax=Brachybacterium equifaecis TaxID=2910770 RepID=A0ABT0R0C7_9MICO|nr:6-phosphogluconolactonase [Brachybacterium equifaecis]MCL6423373.1 6-phosphogluconolactonase [Brachybacterium equifaecis]
MITTLNDTTASAIDKKMTEMRETFGVSTLSRVLTLIIVATGEDIDAPLQAAVKASHEHPSRVIVVDADTEAPTGLDAEIRVGRDAGAGEIIILRARGEVMTSLDTLINPLLLPDSPIVTWWPENAPSSPMHDTLGSISQRRITDAMACPEPLATMKRLRRGYGSGDSDLSWARLTRWRGLVASAFELPPQSMPSEIVVIGDAEDPSTVLMAAWLSMELGVEAEIQAPTIARGPGLVGVRFVREDGRIELIRTAPDSVDLRLSGDQEDQKIPMVERGLDELLAEELRRLDPDEVYGETLAHAFSGIEDASTYAEGKPAPADVVSASEEELSLRAADDIAALLAAAIRERGEAHLVVTGGTVGTRVAAALPRAFSARQVDASAVHVWWGDERFVEDGSPDRNDEQIRESFLEAVDLNPAKVHRVPSSTSGMSLEDAAAWYGQQLDRAGGDQPFHTRGQAFFDALLLGMGPDGHVASLFPEHPDQGRDAASAIAVHDSPKPPPERVSMSWPVLNSARHVVLLAAGEEKAGAVRAAHGGIDPWNVPASSVRGLESTTWYLDEASAAELETASAGDLGDAQKGSAED